MSSTLGGAYCGASGNFYCPQELFVVNRKSVHVSESVVPYSDHESIKNQAVHAATQFEKISPLSE